MLVFIETYQLDREHFIQQLMSRTQVTQKLEDNNRYLRGVSISSFE